MQDILRSPQGGQALQRLETGWQNSTTSQDYPDRDGITSLVYPQELSGSDGKMNRLYHWLAPFYDLSERVFGRLLTGFDMQEGRQKIVDLLPIEPGMRFLEVSPGPGVFQPMLRARLGEAAEFAALDLSLDMLRECRRQHAQERVELVQGNAQYLPFADNAFDGLFHFGGVNLFNDPDLALAEFVRVVRPGGLVAWGDEQMDESFSHPVGKKMLPKMNPGFLRVPPEPPEGLTGLSRHVVYEGLGYLMVGHKA